MWIGHNCWISFCHFFDIVNLVIFHPEYIDRGYLLCNNNIIVGSVFVTFSTLST